MTRLSVLTLLTISLVSVTLKADVTPPPGFTAIFNGKNFSGWHGMGHFSPYALDKLSPVDKLKKRVADTEKAMVHWTIENGELVNDGKGPYLTTDKEYGDIELRLEYKTVAKADSGVYLRATPQVQIWDYTKEGGKWGIGADKGSGGLWNNSKGAKGKDPLVLADKPFGEWNKFRIVQVGEHTSIWLNGKLVVNNAVMENFWNRKIPLRKKGSIQLQTHGGEIRWRNVFVKELSSTEALNHLKRGEGKGFEKAFNGKDLTGWAGAVNGYEVVDGILKCKRKSGGCLFTEKELFDFQVAFEFKLPPGGNNGLAIRYPQRDLNHKDEKVRKQAENDKAGRTDTAYSGMCELQVLDNTAKGYAKLAKQQYHGSAYGMTAAKRGYLKPVGQWNNQIVTVKGHTIKVVLNGYTILDTDLSKVKQKDAMASLAKFKGRLRLSGRFGFAGHGSPVSFKNVYIRELVRD